MSDSKPADTTAAAAPAAGAPPAAAPATPPKSSAAAGILKLLIPAMLAAGAAYGGTRFAAAHPPAAAAGHAEHDDKRLESHGPPGPTLPLEPFLVTLFDANKKPHPMKMTIAVEFSHETHDDLKTYVPRIRDAFLGHLRTLTHEQATDPAQIEKLRKDLAEKCREIGAKGAERILVTDFVVQ